MTTSIHHVEAHPPVDGSMISVSTNESSSQSEEKSKRRVYSNVLRGSSSPVRGTRVTEIPFKRKYRMSDSPKLSCNRGNSSSKSTVAEWISLSLRRLKRKVSRLMTCSAVRFSCSPSIILDIFFRESLLVRKKSEVFWIDHMGMPH